MSWGVALRVAAVAGDLAGAAEGLNLIVVQVESLQAFVLGMRIDGAKVTPNLDRLAPESLVFEEFYEQTGVGRTAGADFIVNCSQYPIVTGAVYYEYPDNDYRCLPGLLANAEYRTAAFQGIRPDFWNLRVVYPDRSTSRRPCFLLGVPAGDAPFFGSDGLAATDPSRFLAFPDGSVLGQGLLWLPRGMRSTERNRCLDMDTRQEVEPVRCTMLAAWVTDELKASEMLIRANVTPPIEDGEDREN